MIANFLSDIKINRVTRYFIYSDLLLFSGWGLVAPVFSIFIIQKIQDADLIVVGIATTIYWVVRSVIQVPLGDFLDRSGREKFPLYTLLLGLVLSSVSAFSFVIIDSIGELYLAQFLHGVGIAFYATAWTPIFTKHLDKEKVSLEWALDSSAVGFASGVTGFLGGYIADLFGFEYIFIFASILSGGAAVIIFLVPSLVMPPKTIPVKKSPPATPPKPGI